MFGKVRSNRGLVRRIENIPTNNDKPNEPVLISAAGVLTPEEVAQADEAAKAANDNSGGEDIWEVGAIKGNELAEVAGLPNRRGEGGCGEAGGSSQSRYETERNWDKVSLAPRL